MSELAELSSYIDFVARRIERTELFKRLPEDWVQGERGGRSWFVPADHVRARAPRVYARPTSIAGIPGQARLHFIEGDLSLRSITIVMEPVAIGTDGAATSGIADVLNAVAVTSVAAMTGDYDPAFVASGALHPHEDGVQLVIDIEPRIDPPASMEDCFVFYD